MRKQIITIVCLTTVITLTCCNSKNGKYVRNERYSTDSTYFHALLKKMIIKNIDPFKSKEFDETTRVFVDTILYSPDSLKAMLLVITENSNTKLPVTSLPYEYNYDGHYLFCKKDRTGEPFKVFTYSPWGLIHFEDYEYLQFRLRHECFRGRIQDKWREREYKLSFDNKRFWSSDEFKEVTSGSEFVTL